MAKPDNSDLANLLSDRKTTKERWQFSLCGMLIVMTIIAISLAFARQYPRTMGVLLAVGIVQAAVLCGADWLVRAKNVKLLTIITAALWALAATGILALLAWQLTVSPAGNGFIFDGSVALIYIACSAFCYYIAWRRLTKRRR